MNTAITDLYNIKPQGLGGAYVESLTSYISREAIKHNITVRDLFIYRILPRCSYENKHKIFNRLFSGNSSIAVNGVNTTTMEIANIIGELTGRNDILKLTLSYWKEVIPSLSLFKKNKHYCPICYAEQKKAGDVYDPLIWSIREIEICSIHNIRLVERCLYEDCNATQYSLEAITIPGYCNVCRRWLGREELNQISNSDSMFIERQHWIINQIGNLIKETNNLNTIIDSKKYIDGLGKIKFEFCENTYVKAREILHIDINIFRRSCAGIGFPSFSNLLIICQSLNINVVPLIKNGEIVECNAQKVELLDSEEYIKKGKARVDYNTICEQLNDYLEINNSDHLTIKDIAKKLNVGVGTLYRMFPIQCKSISAENRRHNHNRTIEREEHLIRAIKDTTKEIYQSGEYPNAQKVQDRISKGAIFKSPILHQAWVDTMVELGLRSK